MRFYLAAILLFISSAVFSQDFGNNPKGKFIFVNGINLYYEIYGDGEPLLLLHGNSQSIKDWQYQIPEFSKYYQVIVPDSRAQGKSGDSSDSLTYGLMAKDMKLLLDGLNIDKCEVVGWSDGGNIGISMALEYPDKIKKLVTVGANYKIDSTVVSSATLELLRNDLKEETDLKQKKLIKLMLNHPNLTEAQLSKIAAPTLVMAGEYDEIKIGHTKKLANAIPKSSLEIVKETGHFIPHENPELFNFLVMKFLAPKSPPTSTGLIIDEKSKEPIVAVNLFYLQSKIGTATDLSGRFDLPLSKIPNDTLVVSSIGYRTKKLVFPLPSKIELQPLDYLLNTVTVRSKPLTAVGIMKQAIENLSKNYPQDKFGFEMYVNQRWDKKNQPSKVAEGILQGYNQTGYSRRVHAYFHLLNKVYFKLIEQRRQNFDSAWVAPYTTDLMYEEVIRFSNNVVNKGNLKNYELNFKEIIELANDTIYVISFKCIKPNYFNTAQTYTSNFTGEVHIRGRDFAIVRYKSVNIADKEALEKMGQKTRFLLANLQQQIEIEYRQIESGYYFPAVVKNFSFTYSGTDKTPVNTYTSETIVYKVNLKDPQSIEPPKNFKSPPIKNAPFNDAFWRNFSKPNPIGK
jgi:pimeloyl-ACP methyl ester carboxylesterase